ncbi:MAG: type 1 glutamine amidotransferase domain-containing protein [Vicingaceae bacterium]
MNNSERKKVAILATDGYEESELMSPKEAMENAGIETHVVSLKHGEIKGWNDGNWSNSVKVDKLVNDVSSSDFNALLIPGGVINPDLLRRDEQAINFVRGFFKEHKPVASICHGPQVLINAEVVDGRKMTSFHSIKKDLMNAGANWVDEEVVVDEGLVTSRNPNDLPAFNSKLVEEVMEGKHEEQTV